MQHLGWNHEGVGEDRTYKKMAKVELNADFIKSDNLDLALTLNEDAYIWAWS